MSFPHLSITLVAMIGIFALIVLLPRSQFKRWLMCGLGVVGWAVLLALPLGAVGLALDTLVFLGSFLTEPPYGLGAWGLGIGASIGFLFGSIRLYNSRRVV